MLSRNRSMIRAENMKEISMFQRPPLSSRFKNFVQVVKREGQRLDVKLPAVAFRYLFGSRETSWHVGTGRPRRRRWSCRQTRPRLRLFTWPPTILSRTKVSLLFDAKLSISRENDVTDVQVGHLQRRFYFHYAKCRRFVTFELIRSRSKTATRYES